MVICKHCKMDIAIRNPSGYCDHLHYPDNCDTCKHLDNDVPATLESKPDTDMFKLASIVKDIWSQIAPIGKYREIVISELNDIINNNSTIS